MKLRHVTSFFVALALSSVACADEIALRDSSHAVSTGLLRVAPTPTVAVLAFTSPGSVLSEGDLQAISSRFESEILSTDSFKVVERRNIDRILREQGFQQSGACDNSECQVQVGQLLGVQSLFIGEVGQIDGVWSLSVKRTDVGTGQTVFSHVLDIKGDKADLLRGGVTRMARIASGREKPGQDRTILVAERPLWPWIVGGATLVGGGVVAAILLADNSSSSTSNSTPASTTYTTEIQWKTQP